MSKVSIGQASSTLIPKYIGSDFDSVITVADNIESVKKVAIMDPADLGTVADNIDQVVAVGDNIEYVVDVAEGLQGMPVTTFAGANPPTVDPIPEGSNWYCTENGRTYIYYVDEDSGQWVESTPQSGWPTEIEGIYNGIRDGVTVSAPTENAVFDALVEKAEKVHSHAISDVTGLQEALDAKAEIAQFEQAGELSPTAAWNAVPAYTDETLGDTLNSQALALTARTELLHEGMTNLHANAVSFIFDDGYDSVRTVLAPLFASYGAKFGAAIPVSYVGSPGRLTYQTLAEFSRTGNEILNHATSGDVMSTPDKGYGGVKAELGTCWDTLNRLGIPNTGFVTPSSVLHENYNDVILEYCDYAFTKAALNTPILPGTNPHALHRFNLSGNSEANCVAAIDALVDVRGAIVFYAHDIADGGTDYLKIEAILARCAEVGIPVLSPRKCIEAAVSPLGDTVRRFLCSDIIDNTIADYNVPAGYGYTTDANKDITITVPAAESFLFQRVINIPTRKDLVDLLTFSASVRDMNNILSNSSVAIKLYSGVNGTGTLLYSTTEQSTPPNNGYVRYYAEAAQAGALSALVYIRCTATAAGTFLIRAPIFQFGTTIGQHKYVDPVTTRYTLAVPDQTIDAITSYLPVTLTTIASNGLFKVENNAFVFMRDATVSINVSLVASGTNVAAGWMGGSCGLKIEGAISCISPVGGGANHVAGGTNVTLKVARGNSVSVVCLASGVPFNIGSTNSRYIVTEL